MKTVACKELDLVCDTTISGQDDEEVIEGVFSHLRDAHPERINTMTEEERLECITSIKELLESAPE